MERSNEQVIITRGNVGQAASFIGITALLIAVLGAFWQGDTSGIIPLLIAIGVLGIVVWVAATPQEFIGFITGRQARRGTVAFFSVILVIGILAVAYIITERAVITLDMTNAQDFSLSAESKRVLAAVNRPIRITGFFSPARVQSQEINDSIFRLYQSETNGLISRAYYDPIQQAAIAELFRAQDGEVFISYLNADGTVDVPSISYVPLLDKQERDMTQAIARLLATGNFTVYFSFGHGELSIADELGTGLSNAYELLRANGLNVFTLNLKVIAENSTSIPENADAIVIVRPQEQFGQPVIDVLDEYLARGGSIFVMADALVSSAPFLAENSTFNQYLWENWGIRMLDAVVVDPVVSDPTPLDIFSYAISDSQITANIDPASNEQSATHFHIARAIEVSETPPAFNGSLIRSSEFSYGETDLERLLQTNNYEFNEGVDREGPQTTVAFAYRADEDGERNGEILLVGDSDFVTNGRLGSPIGNAYLFTDGIGWMTDFDDQVRIGSQAFGVAPPLIFVSPSQLDQIAFVTLFLMPGLTLALGAGIWFFRSRR